MDSRLAGTDAFKNYFNTSRGEVNQPKQQIVPVPEIDVSQEDERLLSQDNIDDVDRLVELLRMLLEKAWNNDMPMLVDEYPTGVDPINIQMPMIVYDYYDRRYSDNTKRAPNLMETIKIGSETYDKLIEKFDCKLQFDICDTSMRAAKILTKKFENFLKTYIPYLKYIGVQQMEFCEEPKARPFQVANQDYPRRTLIYNVKIEKIYLRRIGDGVINDIMIVLNIDTNQSSEGVPGIDVEYKDKKQGL